MPASNAFGPSPPPKKKGLPDRSPSNGVQHFADVHLALFSPRQNPLFLWFLVFLDTCTDTQTRPPLHPRPPSTESSGSCVLLSAVRTCQCSHVVILHGWGPLADFPGCTVGVKESIIGGVVAARHVG